MQWELEKFIEDWHWDEPSHQFARQAGQFLLQFIDHLATTGLSEQTFRKHASNAELIGYLTCQYGYHKVFSPGVFVNASYHLIEFRRKVSDSKYAVDSYTTTWRKLDRYVRSLGYEERK